MKNVKFQKTSEGNFFFYNAADGKEVCFEYKPSIEGVWDKINAQDFEVELLIHPYLNRESNVFPLVADVTGTVETVGYVFPVAALDNDSFEPKRSADNNYLFIAYQALLERLPGVNQDADSLGDCFEENICVLVLNLRTLGNCFSLSSCIHSLRMVGYSYFVENNTIKPIEGYSYDYYRDLIDKRIHLTFSEPYLYSEPIIDDILRNLPKADNLVYRFILLYQVIELLVSNRMNFDIKAAISTYQNSLVSSENDFIEKINSIRKERGVIFEILNSCCISATTPCYKLFSDSCEHLFAVCRYSSHNNKKEELFYDFRNQMVHSYRNLRMFTEELSHVVFHFEQVVMNIIEKYPGV